MYQNHHTFSMTLIPGNLSINICKICNKIHQKSTKIFKIQSLKYAQNDLEIPAFKLYPVLGKLKIFLSNIDQVKFARMTGSGSTIVAYFSNKKSAINGLKIIKKKFKNHWSIVSKTI